MKDQYVADIGDYGKYSLLKAFLDAGISVGINWYLTEDDGTSDGNLTGYLKDGSKDSLDPYDPEVFEALKQIIKTDRTVHGVEKSGLLSGCLFYGERMDFQGSIKERREKRRIWHQKAMKSLSGAKLIFLDPDNGLREKRSTGKTAVKYTFADEIRDYYDKGFNVVYYCHRGRRKADAWEKYKHIMSNILPDAHLIVLTYHKGTQRSYIFLTHKKDYKRYSKIISLFLPKWEGKFYYDQSELFEKLIAKKDEEAAMTGVIRPNPVYCRTCKWSHGKAPYADTPEKANCMVYEKEFKPREVLFTGAKCAFYIELKKEKTNN